MERIQGGRRVKYGFSRPRRLAGYVEGGARARARVWLGTAALLWCLGACAPQSAVVAPTAPPTVAVGGQGTAGPALAEEAPAEAAEEEWPPFEVRSEQVEKDGDVVVTLEFPSFRAPPGDVRWRAAAAELSTTVRAIFVTQMREFERHGADSQQSVASGLPPFSLHVRCEVTASGASLVSMACSQHSYTGGAHGNHQTGGYTFAIRRGHLRRLALNDLFERPKLARAKLNELCLADLRRQGAESVASGGVSELSHMIEEFAIADDGLRIFFPPYAVAPYAAGEYTVLLPWKELTALLRTDPPMRSVLQSLK